MFRSGLKAAAAALILAAGLIVPVIRATPTVAAATPRGVYVAQASGENWSDAVSRQIADYPSFRPAVAAWLPIWTANAEKGGKLGIGQDSSALQLAQLSRVGAALRNPASVVRKPGIYSTHAAAAPVAQKAITPFFVDVNNPNSWSVRGAPGGNGNTYWSGLVSILSIRFCAGTCTVEDNISSRSQVNPGASKDLISITQAYYPDSGGMDRSVEYLFKSINRSVVTATGFNYITFEPGAVGANNAFNQGNGINYNKKVLTVAVGTGVVIYPPPYNGDRMWDGAKTRDASCSSTTCHY